MKIPGKKQAAWATAFWLISAVSIGAQQPASSDSVAFGADRVAYDVTAKRVELTGNAQLAYRGMTLTAGHIIYNRETRRVEAEALPDSAGNRTVGLPQFERGTERLTGAHMVYNLKTERGRIRAGKAAYQRKYYHGKSIVLDSPEALNARDLSLSTCDRDHVHYDFLCKSVRVLQNDKAIGRSITFRIGPVPIFWMPFFVFPVKQGRQSGLLTPGVGNNSRDGIFVRDLGYYYAPSDYWDATLKGTFRERGGFLIQSNVVYNVRNRLSGSVALDYERSTLEGANNWRVNVQHQQRINATTNVRGSGEFSTSTGFDQRNTDNLYTYLNRQLRSSASFDKRWTESGRSVDGSITYYRDLQSKTNRFQGFPRLSFRQGRRALFGASSPGLPTGGPWYRTVYYSFSSTFNNSFTRHPDSVQNAENLNLQSLLTINSQHRPMGWLDLSPSFSLNETFIRSSTDTTTRRESLTAGLSTGTTLYGIFAPSIGRLRGIRHRLQPRVTFNYNQNATIAGGAFGFGGSRDWADPRRSLGLNLGNTLEFKTDRDGDVRRFTLATLNLSTGYDFDTRGQKWRPLSTSASIKPDARIDMRLNMSHRLYDQTGKRSLLHPRLQNLTLTSNFRFSGRRTSGVQDGNPMRFGDAMPQSDFGFERDLYDDFGDVTQPWRLNLTHYVSFQRFALTDPFTRRSWVKADVGFNPTRTLRFDYAINIDIIPDARIAAQSLSLYRDLHCWEARFAWYPSGFNRGFFFKINIKDIPQIKLEHRRGGFGI